MKRSKLFLLGLSPLLLLGTLVSCKANSTVKHDVFVKDENFDYLYDVSYDNYSWADVNEWMNSKNSVNENQGAFGCSSIHYGNFYGRSFDFCYTKMCEFLVKTKNENGHFASIGVSIADCHVTDENVKHINEGKNLSKKEALNEKLIPFALVDGINENGVVCNTNVVPAKDLTPHEGETMYHTHGTNPGKTDLFYQFMPRYILDNATSAKHAVELLRQHNLTALNKDGKVCDYFGVSEMGYELHCMIADKKDTFVVEMVDDEFNVVKTGGHVMTNFYLSNMTPSGQGLERYATLFDYWKKWEKADEDKDTDNMCSVEEMEEAIHEVKYSPSYNPEWQGVGIDPGVPMWPTEFSGNGVPFYDAEKKCRELWDEKLKAKLAAEWDILGGDPVPVEQMKSDTPWISTHAEVFDIKAKTLYLVTREKENGEAYDFKPYKL